MPNRIIKESICTSKNLNTLSAEAERLFYRLMVKCDDFGRYFADADIIKGNCFPRKPEIKAKDIEKWLKELVKAELIIIYRIKDESYLQYVTFGEHQTRRANRSKYPDPREQLQANESGCLQTKTNAPLFENVFENVFENENDNSEKQKHGKHVLLTPEEYQKLNDEYGEEVAQDHIERLNDYIEQIGTKKASAKYKSHYATIRNWLRRDGIKKKTKIPPLKPTDDPIIRMGLEMKQKREMLENDRASPTV